MLPMGSVEWNRMAILTASKIILLFLWLFYVVLMGLGVLYVWTKYWVRFPFNAPQRMSLDWNKTTTKTTRTSQAIQSISCCAICDIDIVIFTQYICQSRSYCSSMTTSNCTHLFHRLLIDTEINVMQQLFRHTYKQLAPSCTQNNLDWSVEIFQVGSHVGIRMQLANMNRFISFPCNFLFSTIYPLPLIVIALLCAERAKHLRTRKYMY